ncbi:AMP-binding protein [Rhodovulum sp. DZ06]|uniref:AMP-binding protein n=1 Tax=Rhodovulum sp. DZ06 TaxID=3425126 RepID=UPI003D356B1C
MTISTRADLAALEAQGYDAVFPDRSPWEMLSRQARERPDAPAIRYLHDATDPARDEVVTFAQLRDRIMGAARLFRAHGVVPGRSVALLTQHSISGQAALWGAQLAGAACPINPMLKPDHVAALIRAADAACVVMTGGNAELDYWSALLPALRAEGIALPIFACDADPGAGSPGADGIFEELVAAPGPDMGPDIDPEGGPETLAAYYHTGGTTGAPKLVRHLRGNEAHVARSCALMHDFSPETVMVNGFPLFHVAGAFVCGLSVLSAGGSLVVPGRLGMRNAAFVSDIWGQVERHRATAICAVPTVLAAIKGIPIKADISSRRWILTGGSPLPTELADAAEAAIGAPVRNILGMTESAGAMAVEPVHGPRLPNSCGLPLPFTEIAILGETGERRTRPGLSRPGRRGSSRSAGRTWRTAIPTRRATRGRSCRAAGWSRAISGGSTKTGGSTSPGARRT